MNVKSYLISADFWVAGVLFLLLGALLNTLFLPNLNNTRELARVEERLNIAHEKVIFIKNKLDIANEKARKSETDINLISTQEKAIITLREELSSQRLQSTEEKKANVQEMNKRNNDLKRTISELRASITKQNKDHEGEISKHLTKISQLEEKIRIAQWDVDLQRSKKQQKIDFIKMCRTSGGSMTPTLGYCASQYEGLSHKN